MGEPSRSPRPRPGRYRAFTLLEILISLVISIVIFGMVWVSVNSCLLYLKRAENKSRALSLTTTMMDRYLAKSFSTVAPGVYTGTEYFDEEKTPFTWKVTVSEGQEKGEKSLFPVPYMKVEAVTMYEEEGPNGSRIPKQIRMVNILPYPFIHVATSHFSPSTDPAAPVAPANEYQDITAPMPVEFRVAKDLMVIYNVAIKISSGAADLTPTDTMYTECLFDGVPQPIETRTPITSQLTINNIVGIKGASPGKHEIALRWKKQTAKSNAGMVLLKEINLIVVACEQK